MKNKMKEVCDDGYKKGLDEVVTKCEIIIVNVLESCKNDNKSMTWKMLYQEKNKIKELRGKI